MQSVLDRRVWAENILSAGVILKIRRRHPSTIGVAVNVGCWSHCRGHTCDRQRAERSL